MPKSQDQIVFLDAATVQYGDVSFKELEARGKLVCHAYTKPGEMRKRLKNATAVITNKCVFEGALFKALPQLKSVHVTATGVNNIDLEGAQRQGVAVTNVAGYSTESVVQCTWSFILALAGNLFNNHQAVKTGKWSRSQSFTLGTYPVTELNGRKLAIVGYGTIGRRVAQVGRALGMKVLVSRIPGRKYSKSETTRRVPFQKVMREADVVSVHAPLTKLTQDLIHGPILRKMKKGALIVNMARGGIVNEKALAQSLKSGHLAGAACDVLTQEPPPKGHVLLKAPNLLLTPHIAWASREARVRLIHEVALNIQAHQQGKKRNRVV